MTLGRIDPKKALMVLIEQKGNCRQPNNLLCVRCPLSNCSLNYLERYKEAVDLYLRSYGTKYDLVEILV